MTEIERPLDHQDRDGEGDIGQIVGRIPAALTQHRWLVILASLLTALTTIAVVLRLPDRYTSEATLFAVQQRVPERYVVSTTTVDLNQDLDAIAQEILSRPLLLGIIDEFGLYSKQKAHLTPEQLVERARKDVTIQQLKSRANGFKISFVAETPQLAQMVTNKLTTTFIEQNLKSRADQATTTTSFLREQLEAAKSQLAEQEQRLRDYKMQYLGELPEQQQGNLGILSGLQNQLDNVMSNRNHAQQQRLYLESLLSEHRRRPRHVDVTALTADSQALTPLEAAQRDLVALQREKRRLLMSYTAQHPDVLKKDQEIRQQQAVVDDLKQTEPAQPLTNVAANDASANDEFNIGVAQLKGQLQANTLEIENLAKKEQSLRGEIDQYRSRLNLTPVREQQLTSMQRDYDLLRQHYGDLLKKEQESQLATNLEKRQEGQRFRLADPPNLPTRPSSPKRVLISLIGLAAGVFLGGALAVLIEARNSSFRTVDDVSRRLALPLVVGIPLSLTQAEESARSRRKAFEWVAACVVFLAVSAAEYYVYLHQ